MNARDISGYPVAWTFAAENSWELKIVLRL